MEWLYVFIIGVVVVLGLYTLGIGVWGLVRKHPFVLSERILMWGFLSTYLLMLVINSFLLFFNREGRLEPILTIVILIQSFLLIMLIFLLWRQMTGYLVIGIYNESFQEALTSTLDKLNIPFEVTRSKRQPQETMSTLRLIEVDAELQARVSPWRGSAQIRAKQRKHVSLIKTIADGMCKYYSNASVKANNTAFIIFLILGIMFLGMAVVLAYIFGL